MMGSESPPGPVMADEKRFRLPRLFWIGFGLLVLGSGPLLAFVAADGLGLVSDPDPNPVGLGLLFFFTFWPAVAVMATGLALALWRAR